MSTFSLLLSGCATTQYTVNGKEAKRDNTLEIVGGIILLGAIAKGISPDKGKEACRSYVSGPNGNYTVTTYQQKCP